MVTLDEERKHERIELPNGIYKGGPEGARAVLSTVAGSMISVTGITFSITIVALTLASSQFGPRLLRNFMRDTGNQFVLGVFLATFVYCLMVLRRVQGTEESMFVPHLSVTIGIILALGSLAVLIYFIHHVAQSIQAESVIAAVGRDLDTAIEESFPELIGKGVPADGNQKPIDFPPESREEATVRSVRSGYIQAIESDGLLRVAIDHDLVVRLNYKPGDYVFNGSPLVQVWSPSKMDDKVGEKIRNVFILGNHRSGEQDPEYAAHQLVEIAIRALSPGINDTFTAINCIDRLGASLSVLAGRVMPSGCRYDEKSNLRVVTDVDTFRGILNAAFDQIRQNGRGNAAVTIRLLEIIREISFHIRLASHRSSLLRQAEMIERGSKTLPEQEDREDVRRMFEEAKRSLQSAAPNSTAVS